MAIYSKGHLQYPVTEFLCFIFRFATHKKLKDVFFFITLQPSSGPYFFCSKFLLAALIFLQVFPPDSRLLLAPVSGYRFKKWTPPPPPHRRNFVPFDISSQKKKPALSCPVCHFGSETRAREIASSWWRGRSQDDEKHLLRWPRHFLAAERI